MSQVSVVHSWILSTCHPTRVTASVQRHNGIPYTVHGTPVQYNRMTVHPHTSTAVQQYTHGPTCLWNTVCTPPHHGPACAPNRKSAERDRKGTDRDGLERTWATVPRAQLVQSASDNVISTPVAPLGAWDPRDPGQYRTLPREP